MTPIVGDISVHISFSGQSSDISCILDFEMYLVYKDTSEVKPSFPWGFPIIVHIGSYLQRGARLAVAA
jgi:hypothetical protein